MSERTTGNGLLPLVARIVSAYIGHNSGSAADLPALIQSVHLALSKLGIEEPPTPVERVPAVPIRKSVFPDHIVCLEDGQKFRTLKRHLATWHDLTPEAYRERWGLPRDYPMVAPSYAAHRSTMAKEIGLGRRPGEMEEVVPVPVQQIAAGVRGKRSVKKLKETAR